jgi:hypothetical protein
VTFIVLLGSFQQFALTIISACSEIRQVEREFGGADRVTFAVAAVKL